MGKTALATNIAFNAAKAYREEHGDDGKPKAVDGAVVGFFSLEMSSEQLATRMLAEQAEVPSEKIRKGELISGDFDKVLSVSQRARASQLLHRRHAGALHRRARAPAPAA